MLDENGFDLWADEYDKSVEISDEENLYPFAGYRNVMNCIFDEIMKKSAASVLDVGFGTATLAKKLYDVDIIFVSYDVYPEIACAMDYISPNGMIAKLMRKINSIKQLKKD